MGIDLTGLNFLRYAARFGALGDTICIGRQGIHIRPKQLHRIFGPVLDWNNEPYGEKLLVNLFAANKVDSVDNSTYENTTFVHDMNLRMPDSFSEYDTVLDFGTIEHIFDVAQALRNIARLCKVNGQILHMSPANNFCGHGFWQISPELFFSLYSVENGFRDTEIFISTRKNPSTWYSVKRPTDGRRIPIMSSKKLYVLCRTVMDHKIRLFEHVQQSDYVVKWNENDSVTSEPSRSNTQAHAETKENKHKVSMTSKWHDIKRRIFHRSSRTVSSFNPNLTRVNLEKLGLPKSLARLSPNRHLDV